MNKASKTKLVMTIINPEIVEMLEARWKSYGQRLKQKLLEIDNSKTYCCQFLYYSLGELTSNIVLSISQLDNDSKMDEILLVGLSGGERKVFCYIPWKTDFSAYLPRLVVDEVEFLNRIISDENCFLELNVENNYAHELRREEF